MSPEHGDDDPGNSDSYTDDEPRKPQRHCRNALLYCQQSVGDVGTHLGLTRLVLSVYERFGNRCGQPCPLVGIRQLSTDKL